MKDPGQTVYKAVFSALNGSTTLPVYSVIPDSVENGYIYLSDFEYSEDDAKDRFMHFGVMQIQIVYPMTGSANDKGPLNTYANEVLNLLRPTINSTLDLTPNFSNTYLYIQNNRELSNLFDDDRTVRRVMQLTLGIEQL